MTKIKIKTCDSCGSREDRYFSIEKCEICGRLFCRNCGPATLEEPVFGKLLFDICGQCNKLHEAKIIRKKYLKIWRRNIKKEREEYLKMKEKSDGKD